MIIMRISLLVSIIFSPSLYFVLLSKTAAAVNDDYGSNDDFTCNIRNDNCPSSSKNDYLCDVSCMENGADCFDCNYFTCHQYSFDCNRCVTAKGCYWCVSSFFFFSIAFFKQKQK